MKVVQVKNLKTTNLFYLNIYFNYFIPYIYYMKYIHQGGIAEICRGVIQQSQTRNQTAFQVLRQFSLAQRQQLDHVREILQQYDLLAVQS